MVGSVERKILREFLTRSGVIKPNDIGRLKAGGGKVPPATLEDRQWLYERLQERAKQNRSLLKLLVAAHFVILLAALCLIYAWRNNPNLVQLISGTSFVALMPVVYNLGKVWKWITTFDVLMTIVPSLSPEDAVKAILSIYFGKEPSATDTVG